MLTSLIVTRAYPPLPDGGEGGEGKGEGRGRVDERKGGAVTVEKGEEEERALGRIAARGGMVNER